MMVKSCSSLRYSFMAMLLITICSIASASSSSSPIITIISDSDVLEALPIVLEQTSYPLAENTDPENEKKSVVIDNVYKRNATGVFKIEGLLTEIKSSGFHHLPRNSTSSKIVKESSTIEGETNEKQIRLGKDLFIGFWIVFGVNYLLWISIGP